MLTFDEYNFEREYKGGKPNPGTPKDKRLSENQGDDDSSSGKKPFPGAAKPFGGNDKGKGKKER